MKPTLLFLTAIAILAGCSSEPCGPGPGDPGAFDITVLTAAGDPLEGAYVAGGVDWESYRVKTDANGIATLPGSARDKPASIVKDNFFPRYICVLRPGDYFMQPTPARLEYVGDVMGSSIRFDPDLLVTLTYQGAYHAYEYDDDSVTELAETQLAAGAIKNVKYVGDRLWLSTHDEGVYVYSAADPLAPSLLFHLSIEGYLGPFAVKENLIAIGDPWGVDPVRVFSFTEDGQVTHLSSIDLYDAGQIEFRGDYLLVLSYSLQYAGGVVFKVVDLGDPAKPVTVYSLVEQGGRAGLILDDYVLIGPHCSPGDYDISYTTLLIHDPANPSYVGRTQSDTFLTTIADGCYGFGAYCNYEFGCSGYTGMYAVACGKLQDSFDAQAVLSESVAPETPGVQSPPYFVVGNGLWRLVDTILQ